MKANKLICKDLMIGDWVYVSKNFIQKYHRIRALSNDEGAVLRGIYVNEYGVECNSVFSPNDTEPIPLTPEILEKNGFKEYDGIYRLDIAEDVFVNALFTSEEPFVSVYNTCYMAKPICRYLHQLQHALRLCGIEKEIIL